MPEDPNTPLPLKMEIDPRHLHALDAFVHPAILGAQPTEAPALPPRIPQPMSAMPAPTDQPPGPFTTPTQAPQAPAAAPAGPKPLSGPIQAHQQNYERLVNSPSGIGGIKHAGARIPLQVLDAIGQGFFPRFEAAIPGTEGHHRALIQGAGQVMKQDQAERAAEAQQEHLGAETEHLKTETTELPKTGEATRAHLGAQTAEIPANAQSERDLKEAEAQSKAHPKQDIHAMHADAVADALERGVDPAEDPKVQKLAGAITDLQKQPVAKEPARDDRAISIYSKPIADRTPEERSYLKGYEQYIEKTKTQPGVARMEVLAGTRTVPVVDPNNPNQVIYMPSAEAARTGAESPQSIPFKASAATTQSFTTGPNATVLNNINTAHAHIQQLGQIAEGLHNGNVVLVNRLANEFAHQTGQPAPASFQLLKTALSAEIAKTTHGGVATEQESNEIGKAINSANSPQSLAGALNAATTLMESKRANLQAQYEAGKKGVPNFTGAETAAPTVTTQAEYDKLPSGTVYMEDGKRYKKP